MIIRPSCLEEFDWPKVGEFEVAIGRGVQVVLHPLDMVSVAVDQLGERFGSLAEQGQTITDALDELLTRSWG